MINPMNWQKAQNLDDAWSNFDPFYPLPSGSPFYVKRDDSPLDRMKRALLRTHNTPQQYFFSGFTGCGKSTELNRLAVDTELQKKFFVVKFSVRDTCDPNSLNYVDVLVAMGAKIFETYTNQGGRLDQGIYREVKTWGQRVEERIQEKGVQSLVEAESGGGVEIPKWIANFFLRLTGRIQTEHSSRSIIRETLEPTLTELLSKINLISAGILNKQKKPVLVLVDDLDKALEEDALKLFKANLSALQQPNFYVVYTVPVWIFYSAEFSAIQPPHASILPNIKLHPKANRTKQDSAGYQVMKEFILRRMSEDLISQPALKYAAQRSGGVLRELARLLQISIDSAIEREAAKVERSDVERAVHELRNEYRRILSEADYEALKEIHANCAYEGIDRIRHLLERLLVLEYENESNWFDVHPVLEEIVQAWQKPRKSRSSPKAS